MIHIRPPLIGLFIAAASMGVLAQGTDEHKAHHPTDGTVPAATAAPDTTARPSPGQAMGADKMAAMDQHMRTMQAMHEKMSAAKTPQERQALMGEHMKVMQDGMRMMASMRSQTASGSQPASMADMRRHHEAMEKRMAMMESMMQMMMDRMSMPESSMSSGR